MSNMTWLSPNDGDPDRRLRASELLADIAVRVRNTDALMHSEISGRGVLVAVFIPGVESTAETRDSIAVKMLSAVNIQAIEAVEKSPEPPVAAGGNKSMPEVLGEDSSPKVSKEK